MEIIPAIYIMDGQCVALYKSSYEQKEIYNKSPLEMAKNFQKQGAKKLYLVDLDGKKDNTFKQQDLFKKIVQTVKIPVMIEAGFNSLEEMEIAFNFDTPQIVVRPKATPLIKEAIQKFGAEKVIVQIQAKGADVVDGFEKKEAYEMDVVDYAETLIPMGVKYIVYKDEISEGTMIHPNYDEVDRLFLITGKDLTIYVSGGIADPKHLQLLKKIGAAGAIIGKAFYERVLTIQEAEDAISD